MSLLVLNEGNRIDRRGHGALPEEPGFEALEPAFIPPGGFPGSYRVPPPIVMDTVYTKLWSVRFDLQIPGLSLSRETECRLRADTIAERIADGTAGICEEFEMKYGDVSMDLGSTVRVGAIYGQSLFQGRPIFSFGSNEWWPSLTVSVSSSRTNFPTHPSTDPDYFYTHADAAISGFLGNIYENASPSGVSVKVNGEEIRLLEFPQEVDPPFITGTHSLSGTIEMTSLEWY